MSGITAGPRLLAAVAAAALTLGACGDDPAPGRVSPEPEAVAMVAADLALVTGLGLQMHEVVALITPAESAVAPAGPAAAVDTLLRGLVDCPLVLHHREAAPSYYELRYGTGCESDLDGLESSGSIRFTVDTEAPFGDFDLRSEFDAFTRDGRRVEGLVDVLGTGTVTLTLEASGVEISGRRATGYFTAALEVTPGDDPCGEGGDPLCRAWQVSEGAGSLSTSLYIYNINVLSPLVLSGCHPHFVQGVIAVTSAGTYPAVVDFGDGTCDDIATMTVEGRVQTITLGYGS